MGRRGDERGNCSYFFSVAAWPGPETKGDPTSNIQIRKLPRRSVAWDGLPPFDPPSSPARSHSPALNLHILLFAKPHAIPAATVGRAAFKRLPAYFPRATIFDRPPSYRIVSYRVVSYRIASRRVVIVAMLGRPFRAHRVCARPRCNTVARPLYIFARGQRRGCGVKTRSMSRAIKQGHRD